MLSRAELGVLLSELAPELTPGEREHVFAAFAALDEGDGAAAVAGDGSGEKVCVSSH